MSIDAQPASPQVFKVELIYDHFWVLICNVLCSIIITMQNKLKIGN
jgi:hypothetical protein